MTDKKVAGSKQQLSTLDMEIALMDSMWANNIIVPNLSYGIIRDMHECDLVVLSLSNYATEIEIKVSKSDIVSDKKKAHGHYHDYLKYLYFAVPGALREFALNNIPHRAGLYVCSRETVQRLDYKGGKRIFVNETVIRVKKVRPAKMNGSVHQWTSYEREHLLRLGAMRILTLKKQLQMLRRSI